MEILRISRLKDVAIGSVVKSDGRLFVVEYREGKRVILTRFDDAGQKISGSVDYRAEVEVIKTPVELAFDYLKTPRCKSASHPAQLSA